MSALTCVAVCLYIFHLSVCVCVFLCVSVCVRVCGLSLCVLTPVTTLQVRGRAAPGPNGKLMVLALGVFVFMVDLFERQSD